MNVPVNLDHTQVARLVSLLGRDGAEPDGDMIIVDQLGRALELAQAQEVERQATSNRIAAERRARIIATAADAQPLLDEIEDSLNEVAAADLPIEERTRRGVDHVQTIKRIRQDIIHAQRSGFAVHDADATLERARMLYRRFLTEIIGLPESSIPADLA